MAVAELTKYAPKFGLTRANEPLTALVNMPELLIPPRLREVVDPGQIVATPTVVRIGGIFSDYGYDLNLAVLLSEQTDTKYKFQAHARNDEHWNSVIERHRTDLVKRGVLCETHKPVIFFAAHSSDQIGASTESFVAHHDMRGMGIGSSFYRNWEALLIEMGYQYMTGNHRFSSRPEFFFDVLGLQRTSTLDPYVTGRLGIEHSDYQSIKFLNDNFEKEVLSTQKE